MIGPSKLRSECTPWPRATSLKRSVDLIMYALVIIIWNLNSDMSWLGDTSDFPGCTTGINEWCCYCPVLGLESPKPSQSVLGTNLKVAQSEFLMWHLLTCARVSLQASINRFKTICLKLKSMGSITALLIQHRYARDPDLLGEFEALAKTAEYNVVGTFDVVGPSSARFGLRGGKVEEIKIWIEAQKPDLVFYSPSLKSSQMYRLKEEWKTEVRDRTQLILEIFDKHARTPQSKLQIEQARLSYELPFVRHQLNEHLDKERSGPRPVGQGIGPGEDPLNLRFMEIRHRIATIEDKLEKISDESELKRKRRVDSGFLEVALAGYTNAGKSTLHRALTGSQVEVANGLFTTLSTKSSDLAMDGRQVVLTDSVGFISDLPKSLLRAFNTTLMEIADADVILLVVDGSDSVSEVRRKANVCLDTFTRIGINGIPIITALNKVDLIDEAGIEQRISALDGIGLQVIPVSAMNYDQSSSVDRGN